MEESIILVKLKKVEEYVNLSRHQLKGTFTTPSATKLIPRPKKQTFILALRPKESKLKPKGTIRAPRTQ